MRVSPRFSVGQLLITPNARDSLDLRDVSDGLVRHMNGDWGLVCAEDKRSNDQALKDGTRLLSAYRDRRNVKFWIITEADRSATTILLPEDY